MRWRVHIVAESRAGLNEAECKGLYVAKVCPLALLGDVLQLAAGDSRVVKADLSESRAVD